MTNSKDIRSRYVLRALGDICLNGDAYVSEDILYKRCQEKQRGLSYETFRADLAEQIRLGYIHPEGSRLYTAKAWRYEEDAAKQLSAILQQPSLSAVVLPENLSVNGIAIPLPGAEGSRGAGFVQPAVHDPGRGRLRKEYPDPGHCQHGWSGAFHGAVRPHRQSGT